MAKNSAHTDGTSPCRTAVCAVEEKGDAFAEHADTVEDYGDERADKLNEIADEME